MRKSLSVLAFASGALAACAGCGKQSSASGWHRAQRHAPREVAVPKLPWEVAEPAGGSNISMPEPSKELMERVEIRVEEVEVDPLALRVPHSKPGHGAVAIRVAVRSEIDQLRLLVEPERFSLENEKKEAMSMRFSDWKDPPLERQFLKTGETVTGWIYFLVPEKERKFRLTTDIRSDPKVEIPIDLDAAAK
ncbi:MAG: hypothetical protein ACUVYA_06840 [Planctomycetota bacterium]